MPRIASTWRPRKPPWRSQTSGSPTRTSAGDKDSKMSRSRKSGGPAPRPEPSRYEIQLTRAAERGLSGLSKSDLRKVDAKIQALAENPRPTGAKKLEGV